MKNREIVNIAGDFGADALRILREVPGLEVTVDRSPRGPLADAVVHFAGSSTPIAVDYKAHVSAATAWQVVHSSGARLDMPLLLVARETTADARRILVACDVAVVDARGNAHLELPGLLIHLEGRRDRPRTARSTARRRLRGKAGVAAQALLLHPGRAWQVRELANEARISAALAHGVLARLEEEGIVLAEGSGPRRVRRVVDPPVLLDLWAEETTDRPTAGLGHVLVQTPGQLLPQVGTSLHRAGVEHALTGPAGASLIAPFVTSMPVVDVWVEATAAIEDLYDATRAAPVTAGHNVVFLQTKDDNPLVFRERVHQLWVANRFRLYVDLRRDPRRGHEQAEHLREEAIGF